MEQQIDPKTKLDIAVGTDPAFIPGLTGPAPAAQKREEEKEKPAPAEAEAVAGKDADAPSDEADDKEPDADHADQVAGADGSDGAGDPERTDHTSGAASPAADGPVFEVSDRRGSISADREGVRFTLDDQAADFRWDEIGAVEVKTPRFGRRFTVTVHVAANRWFNADVDAPARANLKEWTAQLDAVLDAYFEEV